MFNKRLNFQVFPHVPKFNLGTGSLEVQLPKLPRVSMQLSHHGNCYANAKCNFANHCVPKWIFRTSWKESRHDSNALMGINQI
jgi:hypothetical protein